MTTKPHQCALALAIPLNRDDFLAEFNLCINKDFAKSFVRKTHNTLTEDALWETYSTDVKTVTSVAEAVETQGVKVLTNATFSDVRELFQRFRVVTLVAHWRSSSFYPADFLDTAQLIKALEQPSTPLMKTFVSALPENCISVLQTLESSPDAKHTLTETLKKEFNNILKSGKLYPDLESNQTCHIAPYDHDYHKYLNRQVIDDIFKDLISPGNRIEFFDQLHSIEKFIMTIPQDYDGLLDFTVCNSALIGNAIKRQRHCIVLVNKESATLKSRMVIYKGIIELLARSDMDYMDAATNIRKAILR